MKRLMLAGAVLAGMAFATPASAVNFTVSESSALGTGNFGTVHRRFLSGRNDGPRLDINMAPYFVVDSGGHFTLDAVVARNGPHC